MTNTLERAKQISEAYTDYNRLDKAKQELQKLQSGRSSLAIHYLNLDHHTISQAVDRVDKDLDSDYNRLTNLVEGREI